ncbi:ERAD-associated protein, partial [Elasticomyces elasticus]
GWNDITNGSVKIMGSDGALAKRRTFAEWLNDFLEADTQMNAYDYEDDNWGGEEEKMMGSDGKSWGADEADDGLIETLLIGGLLAALGWLVWFWQ